MLLRKLVVVGLVGFFSFAANIATAEDAGAPQIAINGISFLDPLGDIAPTQLNLSTGPSDDRRFTELGRTDFSQDADRRRDYQVSVAARATDELDVSFTQRGGVGFNDQGDVESQSRSTELRLGRGLGMSNNQPSRTPTWYFFAASEDEALTWRPGGSARNAFGGLGGGGSFGLQDQVEIGDIQAGVTYQVGRVQASLAYVEREISVTQGSRTFRQDENFAGLTVTMRR